MLRRSSRFALVLVACVLSLESLATAALVENWDSLPATPAPTSAGVFYPLGDGWNARVSDLTQSNYYGVASNAVGQTADSTPNWVAQVDGNNRDGSTASMLVISPTFLIDGSGNPITMAAEGGANGATPPTSIAGIGTTLAATGSGWEGVVLLDSAGNVLESAQRSGNGADWQTLQLPTTGLSTSTLYRVAMVDTFTGGWGWIALDNVNIPGSAAPEPASFVLAGLGAVGLFVVIRRRRKA
jgi:hypothetical protein